MRYLFGTLNLGASAVVGLAALIVGAMACDEGCAEPGAMFGDWSRSPDSWQWDAIQVLGGALFVAAVLLFFQAAMLRVGPALISLGAQAVISLMLVGLVAAAEFHDITPEAVLAAFAPMFLGGATVLAARRARRLNDPGIRACASP